ncbi:MAG: NTP transferase domain-containing protein [Clostridia bacterium]|nr:NTP transferase domain-containing protein [Clostridia bacterium]
MKAIVMAGGEGSRLRPLTCTVPKPMVRVLGKPILAYIFDLLLRHGVEEAAVTLGYLPEIIPAAFPSGYHGLPLRFVREEQPLGTAGSVKHAAGVQEAPFLVISGDAMCNFDLTKILAYHNAVGAKITIVAVDAADPREYGLLRTDAENRVTGFLEKPAWSQAVSRKANTGVYIVNPECLDLIPRGRYYDFAGDLFPLMLEREMPIYCYHADAYWCDVGNIDAYLRCQQEVMQGAMPAPCRQPAPGIFAQAALPPGEYTLHPPVYIGADVRIGARAEIGPFAVLDQGASLGAQSKVCYGAVLENAVVEQGAHVTGALVCADAVVQAGAALYENSVVGAGSVIGAQAEIRPQVLIWPGKKVERGAQVDANVKYGSVRTRYLGADGVDESGGGRLNAATCVRLGAAVATAMQGGPVGLAHDGSARGAAMVRALGCGLTDIGSPVLDFGDCFEAQFRYLVQHCGLGAGVFAVGGAQRALHFCGEHGLPVTRAFERSVESGMLHADFHEAPDDGLREVQQAGAAKQLYKYAMLRLAPLGLHGTAASVRSENGGVAAILSSALRMMGCAQSDRLQLVIAPDGLSATAVLDGAEISHDRLLTVCCYHALRSGRDVAVPYDAPMLLDDLAAECGRRILRYLRTPADDADAAARRLAAEQGFVRDGSFLAVQLLSVMRVRGCTLDVLLSELPARFVAARTVPLGFAPSALAETVGGTPEGSNYFEGVRLTKREGKLLFVPECAGDRVRILAEADSMEAAQALCMDAAALCKRPAKAGEAELFSNNS